MNNLLSYCGLADASIIASEKDLRVLSVPTTNLIHKDLLEMKHTLLIPTFC